MIPFQIEYFVLILIRVALNDLANVDENDDILSRVYIIVVPISLSNVTMQ